MTFVEWVKSYEAEHGPIDAMGIGAWQVAKDAWQAGFESCRGDQR